MTPRRSWYNGVMRALVKIAPGPGLTFTDAPDPRPAPSEAVIRVKATSLCGTDAHIYNWDEWAHSRIQPPRIILTEHGFDDVSVGAPQAENSGGALFEGESYVVFGRNFTSLASLSAAPDISSDAPRLGIADVLDLSDGADSLWMDGAANDETSDEAIGSTAMSGQAWQHCWSAQPAAPVDLESGP